MHDCNWVAGRIAEHNASLRWWQFWRTRREQITICGDCRKRADWRCSCGKSID